MSLLSKVPIQNVMKRRRIPNAFMLFVKENKGKLMQKHPGENLAVIGTYLGKKWKSLDSEEKQVYYDQYKVLKEKYEASVNVMDNDLIREIDEITKDMPKLAKPDDASEACDVNEGPSDDSKKLKTRTLKSNEDGIVLPADAKGTKKVTRRSKNPFLIFAKEQRDNVKPTPKNHKSTILGHMWHDLDYSEKKKYVERAKIESILEADATPSGPSTSDSKTKKRKSKKVLRKFLSRQSRGGTERTLSKKNEAKSSIESTVEAVASGTSSAVPEVPSVSNPSDSTPRHHVSQSCSSASCTCLPTSSSCFATPSSTQCPTHSGAFPEPSSSFGQASSACHSREPAFRGHGSSSNNFSQPLCLHSASADSLVPNQGYFGGLYRPYFSGMPGFYPPDPLSYFWIYQQSMSPYNPFAAFYQSHCPCSSSYGAYPGSHFRSFIYGQSGSSYPSATPASFSQNAQASTTVPRDDVAPNPNRQGYSEREASDNENNLVIVDDEQEGNEERQASNKESPRQ